VWWVRSRRVEVYLGSTLVGCRGLDDLTERWAEVASLDEGLARLTEWMAVAAVPLRARVWLGSALARPFVVAADAGARDAGEASELARAVASDATGLGGELKVWLAPWRARRATLAVAIPQLLLSALEATAGQRRGQRVVSVRPWWNQVLDDAIERSRGQARSIGWSLTEPDGLVQGRLDAGQVVEAGFEAPRVHDPGGTMSRRRLQIGWGEIDLVEHFAFRPMGALDGRQAIGATEPVRLGEVVA
jgi:hypothetical protein